jgi:hypothetical protein
LHTATPLRRNSRQSQSSTVYSILVAIQVATHRTIRSASLRFLAWSAGIARFGVSTSNTAGDDSVFRLAAWRLVCLAGAWLIAGAAAADIVVLTSGARLEGTLVNAGQSPRKNYVIKTDSGEITIDKAQVKEVITQSPEERQYERIRFSFADSALEQWKLAEWCRENGLSAQRTAHLERVVELDPDHKQARTALGFSKIDGKWNRREDALTARGFVQYRGRWMLPQDAEIQERKAKLEASQKAWFLKLRQWRAQLDDRGPRAEAALAELKALSDPAALPAIVDAFKAAPSAKVQALLIDALARIQTADSVRLLSEIALESGNEEIRLTAVDHLKNLKGPAAAEYFIAALAGNDNAKINRAGVALGELGNKAAIGPLIGALVSIYKQKVQQGGSGTISPSFDSSGGIGFGVGGKSVVLRNRVQNRGVHEGLVKLAGGADFGYDTVAWANWLKDQNKAVVVPGRRD